MNIAKNKNLRGSQVDVLKASNQQARNMIIEIEEKTDITLPIKDFYSRVIDFVMEDDDIRTRILDKFCKPENSEFLIISR